VQQPRFPIWIGGESEAAMRRAARHGDAWFSYFVRTTAAELGARFEQLRQLTLEAGRDAGSVRQCSVRPIDVTAEPVAQAPDALRGTPAQLVDALQRFEDVGVEHMALQFHRGRWPERRDQIERFGQEVIPAMGG
jgi:alkanesulfonate monooxygenase SsuD/methylene tetrahydromethanopterin reductase-like flavin-dependent oxidoreductase (luciferase family)